MNMEAESHQGPWSPSAKSGSSRNPISQEIPAKAAEVSPGDGAYSPQNDDIDIVKLGDGVVGVVDVGGGCRGGGGGGGDDDVGFGPPPAFPSSNKKSLGKRKHTLIAVSATATATAAASAAGGGGPYPESWYPGGGGGAPPRPYTAGGGGTPRP